MSKWNAQAGRARMAAMRTAVSMFTALAFAAPTAGEGASADAGFDQTPAGEAPTELAYPQQVASGVLQVVGAETSPADPFDGADNRSLYIRQKPAAAQPQFAWAADTPIESRGRFEVRFFAPKPDGEANTEPALVRIKIGQRRRNDDGQPVSAVDRGIQLILREDGAMKYAKPVEVPNRASNFDQSLPRGVAHKLVITFDLDEQRWSGTIDGVPLTDREGEIEAFRFKRPTERVDAIELRVGRSNQKTQHIFVDDVSLRTGDAAATE